MPQKAPAIGDDVTHLFGGGGAPAVGEDVTHLFSGSGGLYDPNRRPVSAEDFAPPQRDVSVGNMLWNGVKSLNPLPALKAMAADQRPEDALLGPGQALAPLIRAAGAGAASEAKKTVAAGRRKDAGAYVGHALATVLPLIGPAAAQAGEDIGSGDTERIERGGGNALGLVGGMLVPGAAARTAPKVAPALATIGEQLASKGKAVAGAVDKINPVVLDVAAEVAGHALGAQLGAPMIARRVLAHVLDSTRKTAKVAEPAPPTAATANAGGRLVPPQTPSMTQALADALAETRVPEPPARVTTAPEAGLPPGYTPRSTVPKPRLVKASIPAPVRAAMEAGEKKRAYFLKPASETAPAAVEDAIAPTGSILPEDLPASWRTRAGQDLFPITGKEGQAVIDAMRQELKDRGLSTGQAIASVSTNKSLPTELRMQLLRALAGGKK